MYTQCPQCLTVFLLDASILGAGRGDLRCGGCGALFSALDAIADEPPGDGLITPTFPTEQPPLVSVLEPEGSDALTFAPAAVSEIPAPSTDEPDLAQQRLELDDDEQPPVERRYLDDGDLDDGQPLAEESLPAAGEEAMEDEESLHFSALDDAEHAALDQATIDGVARPRHPDELLAGPRQGAADGRRSVGWSLLAGVLSLALLAQLAWYERDGLIHDSRVRPLLAALCDSIGCTLPLRQDLARIRLASRDIRAHPSVEGALLINATVQNRADFQQPWPDVVIRLSDLQGRPVAARRFVPVEYLERPELEARGIAPGTLVPLVFEVVDPGDAAVAFDFDFR